MAGDRRAHPNVCRRLVLQVCFYQGAAMALLRNQGGQEDGLGGNLAICISGGLRTGDECAESHVRSIVEPNRMTFRHIKIFFATWAERQCSETGFGPVTESFIRELYPNQDMDVWIGDDLGHPAGMYPLSQVTDYPDPFDNVYYNATWPSRWSYRMFQSCRNMASLWRKCMDMIPDTYDVIVRLRPDWCFPYSYQLMVFRNTVKVVRPDNTNAVFSAHLEEGKVLLPKNYHHSKDIPDIPDDRMGIGLAKSMKQAFGTLVQRADQRDFDLTDEQYYNKWGNVDTGTKGVLLNPHGFWVRERAPEILLAHHLLDMKINYTFIEPQGLSLWDIGARGNRCRSNHTHGNTVEEIRRGLNPDDYDYN
jgi:hypothetical protein